MTGYCASSHPQSGLLLRVIPPSCLFVFRGSIKLSWHLVWIISSIMAPSFFSSHAFYQHNRPLMKYYKPPALSLCIAELCKRAETKRVVGWRWYSNSKWCLQIGINNAGEMAERFSRTVSLDRLLLKVLHERGLVKYVISGSCKHVMLRLVGGDIFNFCWVLHKGEWRMSVNPWKWRERLMVCILAYIMHFMHLCYAKEPWWKEFHHWEMEIQLPLPLHIPPPSPWSHVLLEVQRCALVEGPPPSTPISHGLCWPL